MSAVVQLVARLLLLPSFMVAAAVLVKGYGSTGDGFAAGSIAALGILMQYVAYGEREASTLLRRRTAENLAIAGLGLMLAVAFVPALAGAPMLSHYPPPGATVRTIGTLELHTAAAYDLGVFCLTLGFVVRVMASVMRAAERRTGR